MGKQPTMGQKKSKDAIARAAAASRKGQKKKWSKGKVKEKANFDVFVTKGQFKDIEKDIQKMRLITIAIISEKYRIVMSVARQLLRHFANEGLILPLDA